MPPTAAALTASAFASACASAFASSEATNRPYAACSRTIMKTAHAQQRQRRQRSTPNVMIDATPQAGTCPSQNCLLVASFNSSSV